MKLPKTTRRLCPYCGKHTEHKIVQAKRASASSLKKGSKYRAKKRGLARGKGNLGRYSKPAITKFKLTGAKQTKKADIRYQCSVCKKMHTQAAGKRSKRLEFV